jgi:hypothetical protein
MSSALQRSLVTWSLALCACTQDREPGEQAPKRDAEVDAASESALLPPCMWTLDACPAHIEWRLDTLLTASDVDADARFIAIGGQAVGVAAGAADTKLVVRVHMDDEIKRYGDKFRRYTLPEDVVDLIDVVDSITAPGVPPTVYALACRQPRAACSLWRISADQPDGAALEEIEGSSFDMGEAKALLFDEDQQQPCALSKGLYCFDGSWREEIPPSTDDNDLRNVAMGTSMSIAVAARGVYWTRRGVPPGQPALPWTRESVDAEVAWNGASDIYTGYFLIGERGAFMQKLSAGQELCSHTSDFAASSGTVLVTEQGDVLFGLNESRCLLQNLGSDPIVGSTTVYCRASQNLLVMTEQSISGTIYCERL